MATTTWLEDIIYPKYPSLEGDISADVAIVGSGMAGTLSAYLLAKEGKKVVMIDKGDIESATTSYTTGWITTDLDTDIADLIKMYGEKGEKNIWDSGNRSIDLIENIIKEENIECEFVRCPVYMYATSSKEDKQLNSEFEAARSIGIEIKKEEKPLEGISSTSYIEIPQQAKFHALKFLIAVQKAAVRYGAQIFHNTEALSIEGIDSVKVATKKGTISAGYSVMATHKPFQNLKELFGIRGVYKSYVYEIDIPKGLIKEGMYLDLANPYHYFRIDPMQGHDRMIVGGEDHRQELKMPEEKNYRALEEYVKDVLFGKEYRIVKKWTGGILENVDGLPCIGVFSEDTPRQLMITAFSGNGMHFSMIAGGIIRDIVLGKNNRDIGIYDARRKVKPRAFYQKFLDFTGELFGGVAKNLFK